MLDNQFDVSYRSCANPLNSRVYFSLTDTVNIRANRQNININHRRTLGEIGNLVGKLSMDCAVNSDAVLEKSQSKNTSENRTISQFTTKSQRPLPRDFGAKISTDLTLLSDKVDSGPSQKQSIRRKFGVNISNNVPLPVGPSESRPLPKDATAPWHHKQTVTMGRPSVNAPFKQSNLPSTNEPLQGSSQLRLPPANYPDENISLDPKNYGSLLAARRKKQTFSGTLTARSEAACGALEVVMAEAEEPMPNIDAQDVGNQLAVVDYVEDIYSFYKRAEIQSCASHEYMNQQTDINAKMRAILIDWLIEVHLKFKLMPETLFLTVNLIDRFLESNQVMRKSLQLVGVTSMLLACKYEEIWAPEINDFVKICDKAYTRDQILEMEKRMLNKLMFNLTVPTPYVFLVRLLKAACSDPRLEMLAFFLTELCLTEYSMIKYRPSCIAASAVYAAQMTLGRSPYWNTLLQRHSGYTEMHLSECAMLMISFHKAAATGALTIVHKKYTNPKYCSVALLEPADLPTLLAKRLAH
ncbi:hypothetical protein KP509_24G055000 [Ceratopteris richardii]|uniref:Uncharacterized protein n=1 Tax=Ceratopteris richardii TaxID=49495 RepID=A0A8T2RXJ6_CERRI|nr:hypothetical protein KP509_24G055000 [Ceratopteris richardii]